MEEKKKIKGTPLIDITLAKLSPKGLVNTLVSHKLSDTEFGVY